MRLAASHVIFHLVPTYKKLLVTMFSYKERMKKEPLDRCFAQLVESDSGYVPDNVITFYISTAVNNIIEFAFVTQNYFHSQRRTHYQQKYHICT